MLSVRARRASRAWPAPTGWCGGSVGAPGARRLPVLCPKSIAGMARSYRVVCGICRSALGRDAFPSVFEEHGHGPLLRVVWGLEERPGRDAFPVRVRRASRAWPAPTEGVVGCLRSARRAMPFRPCPESIAGMARSYKGGVARSVEAPGACALPVRVRRASRAWPAPTEGRGGVCRSAWGAMLSCPCPESIAGMARSYRGCGGVCRSALGRDALPSVPGEHRGHGPLRQRRCGAVWRSALGCDAFPSVFEEHRGHGPLLQRVWWGL